MKLAGTDVLLTGGGRGLGRHMAERLAADGARVWALERDAVLCDELKAAGMQALACDVTNPAAIDATLQAAEAQGAAFAVLINNAGLIHSEPLVNMLSRGERAHSRDSWRTVLGANLDSVFYVTSRAVDRMLAQRIKGVVVSVSSIAAQGNAGQSAYSAAKAGVNALTRSWAKELGPLGYRFAAVAPGFIDTPSTRAALSEPIIDQLKKKIPLRRLGEPESVYLAVRQIIENDYLNGIVLDVDGGLTL
ncbi:SDR family NAD(P)-dependent oxidoreductase [Roseateles sp.]|jgi:3-oxoacyl-[acyl-carrier protein] reductase|uniref:SDR family NAD(P)-dependent oxidoreductase n=1 Tax=Roseateles sp. TaxID=1971397 RepID=UPI0037C7D7EA